MKMNLINKMNRVLCNNKKEYPVNVRNCKIDFLKMTFINFTRVKVSRVH